MVMTERKEAVVEKRKSGWALDVWGLFISLAPKDVDIF